jgi:hypothetical protein
MGETVEVVGADVVDGTKIVVDLSDGFSVVYSLKQLLTLEPISLVVNDGDSLG